MLQLTEEADKFKGLEKEKRAEFELRIRELEYDVADGMARARVLAEAFAVTDQARSTAADEIDSAEKARVLAEEAAVAITDQARSTAADDIVAVEKAREELERKIGEPSIQMVEVFEKSASLSAIGEISTAADIDDGEEMGEGLEPSMSLNQKADRPMSSIFGFEAFSCGDNMLAMETVLVVQRENSTSRRHCRRRKRNSGR